MGTERPAVEGHCHWGLFYMEGCPLKCGGAQKTIWGADLSIGGARAPPKVYKSTPMNRSTVKSGKLKLVPFYVVY